MVAADGRRLDRRQVRILTETQARDVVADPLAWWEKCVAGAGIPALVRILVAQAIAEDLTLASKDDLLAQYGVPVVW
jgi:hypothetical protein